MAEVIARVISQEGTCAAGHRVGDEFNVGEKPPQGICSWAYYTLFPFVQVLKHGGTLPWEKDPDKALVACCDPANPVVFELRRILP